MKDPTLFIIALTTLIYSGLIVAVEGKHTRLVSPLALFAGLTILHFCTPAMLMAFDTGHAFYNPLYESYTTEAMLFVLFVLIAMQFGVWGVAHWYQGDKPIRPIQRLPEWRSTNVLLVCSVLLLVGWLTRVYIIESHAYFQFARAVHGELEGPFLSAIRTLELFPLQTLFILTIHASSQMETDSRRWKHLVTVVMLMEFMYWLPTGRKEETIHVLLVPVLIRYLQTGLLPSRTRCLGLVGFIAALFPLAYYYRFVLQQVILGQLVSSNFSLAGAISDAVAVMDAGATEQIEDDAGDVTTQRLDLLEPVSACVAMVMRGDWPLELGVGYAKTLLTVVPRVLWPSKPALDYGVEFGQVSGLSGIDDWMTSISVTYPGEAFLNFGWFGCLVFLPIGAAYGYLYEAVKYSRRNETATLMYAVTLPVILYLGGTFAGFVGGLLKLLPFYLVLGWLMSRRVELLADRQHLKVAT